jgi:hypothetical protein
MPKAIKHSDSTAAKIRTYLRANPTAMPKKVAEMFNTNAQHVSVIKYGMKKAGEKTVPVPRTSRPVPKKWEAAQVVTSSKPIVNPQIEAELAYAVGKGRDRVHPVTGKILMQGPDPMPVTMEGPEAERVEDHPLYAIFYAAIEQAMFGKGERHGGARTPFFEQPWAHYVKLHGRGFATGQAAKKLEEAATTRTGVPFEQEVFGAMVYLGMAVLEDRRREVELKR